MLKWILNDKNYIIKNNELQKYHFASLFDNKKWNH